MGQIMHLPTDSEIFELHRKYAKSADLLIATWSHCQIVADIADQLIETGKLKVNRDLVHAGCLLHDIGVHELPREHGKTKPGQYIRHGILGYKLLKKAGFSEELCRFASHHTGVGLTKAEIISAHLDLPPADYLAETAEERLVMYADEFHSKFPLRFETVASVKKEIAAYGGDNPKRLQALIDEFGEPNIKKLAKQHSQPIVS